MISRRTFLRWLARLGATGALAATYGILVEPLLRLRVARYDLHPARWPAGLDLKIAALADIHACEPWMSQARIRSIVEHTNSSRRRPDRAARRLRRRSSLHHRPGRGARLGGRAVGPQGAARRARDPRQSRMVGGSHRAARRARARRAAGARSRRSASRSTTTTWCGWARQGSRSGSPAWATSSRSGRPGAATRAVATASMTSPPPGQGHRRRAGDSAGARARHRGAGCRSACR